MERVLTVSQLNEYVRRSLATDPMLKGVRLRGEISNFKRHGAGHLYFSLKDEEARIACVMFRSAASGLSITLRDGMRVVASGSAALYAAAGQYQFYVDSLKDDGIGGLYAEFIKLKERLQAEGLFDAGLKKPLPLLPRGVGIVTSATGAVLQDIRQVARRRNPGVPLLLYPAAVQGERAAREIVRGIVALDARADVDVIIIGRGGGALEELWPFNEEAVARAIFACETPVISAVGHETDFSIADFVADVRAPTPSAAAELAVPSRVELRAQLDAYVQQMERLQRHRLALWSARLQSVHSRLTAHHPARHLTSRRQRLVAQRAALDARLDALIQARRLALGTQRLRLLQRIQGLLSACKLRLTALSATLSALSPAQVLDRGYALVTTPGGTPLVSSRHTHPGERIRVQWKEGALCAIVEEVTHGGEEAKTGF